MVRGDIEVKEKGSSGEGGGWSILASMGFSAQIICEAQRNHYIFDWRGESNRCGG